LIASAFCIEAGEKTGDLTALARGSDAGHRPDRVAGKSFRCSLILRARRSVSSADAVTGSALPAAGSSLHTGYDGDRAEPDRSG